MNLLQIRTKFKTLSGRHDLVNSDGSDNGADFFLNEGRKFLDRLNETQKSWGSAFVKVSSGFWYATFPYCRAIKEVHAATSSSRRQLTKKNLQDLIEGYLTGLPSSRSSGTALYYSPCITRIIPEDITADQLDAFIGFIDIQSGGSHEYNTILLNVPVSEDTVIIVNGLFYSTELISDTDTNYWTDLHPQLLIHSAMRQVEIANRNTQGVNDWTSAIATEMDQLGFDLVEELIAEVNQMEG